MEDVDHAVPFWGCAGTECTLGEPEPKCRLLHHPLSCLGTRDRCHPLLTPDCSIVALSSPYRGFWSLNGGTGDDRTRDLYVRWHYAISRICGSCSVRWHSFDNCFWRSRWIAWVHDFIVAAACVGRTDFLLSVPMALAHIGFRTPYSQSRAKQTRKWRPCFAYVLDVMDDVALYRDAVSTSKCPESSFQEVGDGWTRGDHSICWLRIDYLRM